MRALGSCPGPFSFRGYTMKRTDTRRARQCLRKAYAVGCEHREWYQEAFGFLSTLVPANHAGVFVGFVAATSANCSVRSNLTLARKAYNQWSHGEPFTGYLSGVTENLRRTVRGEPLQGAKLEPFRQAIMGDPQAVAVDRWVIRAAGYPGATPKRMRHVDGDIRVLARREGITPAEYQAAVWAGAIMEAGGEPDNYDAGQPGAIMEALL